MSTGTLFTLVIQDDMPYRTETKQYLFSSGSKPDELLRDLADEFIQTPEGMAISMKEGEMTWGTLLEQLESYEHKHLLSNNCIHPLHEGSSLYPLTVIDSVTSVVDEDENLVTVVL